MASFQGRLPTFLSHVCFFATLKQFSQQTQMCERSIRCHHLWGCPRSIPRPCEPRLINWAFFWSQNRSLKSCGVFFGGGEGVEGSGTKSCTVGTWNQSRLAWPRAVKQRLQSRVLGVQTLSTEPKSCILGPSNRPQILRASAWKAEPWPSAVRARPRAHRGGFRAESAGQSLPRGAPQQRQSSGRSSSHARDTCGASPRWGRGGGCRAGSAALRGSWGRCPGTRDQPPPRCQVREAPRLLPGRAGRSRGQEAVREPRCSRVVPRPLPGDPGAGTAGPGTRCGGGPGRGFPAFIRGLRGAAAPVQRPRAPRSGTGAGRERGSGAAGSRSPPAPPARGAGTGRVTPRQGG